ncbi:MAG: aminotransferase class I/II-fold pyridoxal phosphate-dependent enzyme [Flavobacteriales bacterium]|nr:aminotransferase class I/II-fold pyridoxal phosphate-dependent enzyme [Flavobacteriales bacterium]
MASKLPQIGTNIFTKMSQLASKTGAINLSQGFPNFKVDPLLSKILVEKATEEVHQYTPMSGSPELLSQISTLVEDSYNRKIDYTEEILVTAGATQAIFTTILALIEKGDEVIILDPSYDCYEPAVILAGGTPVRIQLDENFLPDWNKINSSISEKTKMLITNNPHNPSGRVWKSNDIDDLEKIMLDHEHLILLSDEVYEFITFEEKHISIHTREKLYNRTIITSSFGKTFHITGWKTGYLVAPKHLMEEIKKVHQFNVFSVNSVAQATLAEYMKQKDVSKLGAFYQKKRDFFRASMSNSRFELLPCEGTYFQTAKYDSISRENDEAFCRRLAIEFGVATIPISVFNNSGFDQNVIRFCFAKTDETLLKATEKLCKI